MYVLVTYDVGTTTPEGRRRLRQVAKTCLNFGQRVQNSVFELKVDPARWTQCRLQLVGLIDEATDSLRFYFLGANWHRRVEHVGAKASHDIDGPLIA
ncbi:MAG TPA: CRISPR-associated endonuclease Cas2 [Pirellulales bacterium]|jgi:CRISPR-associated protein Cas2|nr:CRISPR-associated endonuclease Cas2 [Pirellulales bacterium]